MREAHDTSRVHQHADGGGGGDDGDFGCAGGGGGVVVGGGVDGDGGCAATGGGFGPVPLLGPPPSEAPGVFVCPG